MLILTIISVALLALYGIMVLYYWYGWQSLPLFDSTAPAPQKKISVIIPARNEERNIGRLLSALEQQTYSNDLYEVIVIDDHSTDKTAEIVKQFPFAKLIQLKEDNLNSYKKKAIETGIASANGELIVTTDADCVPPSGWLQTIVAFQLKQKAIVIAAPVSLDCNSSVLQVFQAMDFMVLQGITGAAVHNRQMSMCNGANLAYERNAFYEVNGFTGIDNIASGDDMLLMYKLEKQNPGRVHFLKSTSAIVSTRPMENWREFFQQRIRWASKATNYEDKRILPVMLIVYLFNLSFLFLFIAMFWNGQLGILLLILLVSKTLVELPLFVSVATFFNKRWAIKWFPLFQPLHILYTIISGLFGQFGKYEWKGRRVK